MKVRAVESTARLLARRLRGWPPNAGRSALTSFTRRVFHRRVGLCYPNR